MRLKSASVGGRIRRTHLVDSNPMLHPVSKPLEQDLGVIDEIIHYLLANESAVLSLEL